MNFVLLGAAGYVAPRHMKAIKETGNNLLAIYDPFDSVGVIDSYFPECRYFRDFERLDRYCDKQQRKGVSIDFVSIASPNYLHEAQCRWALRMGAHVICEKPLVLSVENFDNLLELQEETNRNIYGLYQLRYAPKIMEMKQAIKPADNVIQIHYCTPRGNWYPYSWKGDILKSGGVETNIGCHFFDLCSYLFPWSFELLDFIPYSYGSSGKIVYEGNNSMEWYLSVKGEPQRVFMLNGVSFSFNDGFADLHTTVYQDILSGQGIPMNVHRASVEICEKIKRRRMT